MMDRALATAGSFSPASHPPSPAFLRVDAGNAFDTLRDQSVELDLRGRRLRLLTGVQAELKDWTSSWGVAVRSTPASAG